MINISKEADMLFKDKDLIAILQSIENKIDILIAMNKTDRIRRANEKTKCIKEGFKNVK